MKTNKIFLWETGYDRQNSRGCERDGDLGTPSFPQDEGALPVPCHPLGSHDGHNKSVVGREHLWGGAAPNGHDKSVENGFRHSRQEGKL